MKNTLTYLTLFALSGGSLLAEEKIAGELVFADGDAFSGSPSGVSEEGHILWQSSLFMDGTNPFLSKQIDSIRFTGQQAAPQGETIAKITFQNRIDKIYDVMEADLLGFDDESVQLRTWYAGDLTLKRSMLHTIEVSTAATPVVNGPGKMDDWQVIEGSTSWRIEGKNLISNARGSIARQFPQLPMKVHLEFDLSFDYSPYLGLNFFASSGSVAIPDSGYSVSIQQGSMQFRKRQDQQRVPLQMDFFAGRHNFKNENTTRVEVFIDREKGKFNLFLDGVLVSSATDPNSLKDDHWFHISTLRGQEQTISNFVFRPWDGTLPERSDHLDFREELPLEGEQIELHNGDTIVGKATAIEDGKLKVETEYTPVAVPIEWLRSFQITSKDEHEKPRLYPEDVRCYFQHGGHVTLRLAALTSDSITGFSQVFGDATFQLDAFTHIEFNPYDPKFRKRRGLPF